MVKWFDNVRWPEEESNANDEQEGSERHMSRLLSLFHLAKAEAQLRAHNENLKRDEQLPHVLEGGREPGVEVAAVSRLVEEQA